MKEKTQEKLLVQANKNGIFYKIKRFFRKLFRKNENVSQANIVESYIDKVVEKENVKSSFLEAIKNIEDDETRLLKLQKQYRSGEIKEEELTQEQVESLCSLYDRQIADLRKSNERIKQKLLKYKEISIFKK